MVICQNKKCGKELKLKPGQKRMNPLRKYCDFRCQTRQNSIDRHYRLRDDPKFKKSKSDFLKKWYKTHKKQQNTNVMKDYQRNKGKWHERQFVQIHRQKLLNLMNQKCICGKPVNIVHHITYSFKRDWKNPGMRGLDQFHLEEYSQFLIGFCSKKCHAHHHRILNDSEDFVSL